MSRYDYTCIYPYLAGDCHNFQATQVWGFWLCGMPTSPYIRSNSSAVTKRTQQCICMNVYVCSRETSGSFFFLSLYLLAFESNRLPGTGGRQMFASLQSSASSSRKQQTISAMGQSQWEMTQSGCLILQLEGGGECHPELAPAP